MTPHDLYALDPLARHAVILGASGLLTLIFYVAEACWSSPRRRKARLRRWAERHVASYDDQWLVPLDELNVANRRVAVVCGFFGLVLLLEIPMGGQTFAAWWIYSLPAVFAVVFGLSATRMSLPPGTRVARLRELEVSDYLPDRTRYFMWIAGAVGFAACLLVGVTRGEWWLGVSGSLMLVAPASVELAARRLARLPEPAQSAAHLYLQDVLRAEHIRWAALSSALSGAMVCNWLSSAVDTTDWLEWTLLGMNLGLLAGFFVVAFNPDMTASIYMRSRLWPQLGAGRLLMRDEPLPPMGATS